MDRPIHTEYFHPGGAATMNFIVNEAKAVDPFVMCSTTLWKMVAPPDNTTLAYKTLRMPTSHFMMLWKEVSWNPLASLPVEPGWKTLSRNGNVGRHQ